MHVLGWLDLGVYSVCSRTDLGSVLPGATAAGSLWRRDKLTDRPWIFAIAFLMAFQQCLHYFHRNFGQRHHRWLRPDYRLRRLQPLRLFR